MISDPTLSDSSATYTPGISESRSGVSSFYGLDRLGSKTLQTNSASAVTYQVSYDAFGNQKSSSGSTVSPFGFVGAAGYQQDSDSGLMLLGHRYYDSSTGRLLTRDPVKDGSNWYYYCRNNSLNKLDPRGHDWITILPGGPFGLPGWTQRPHGGPEKVPGGFDRYYPPGTKEAFKNADGLEFHQVQGQSAGPIGTTLRPGNRKMSILSQANLIQCKSRLVMLAVVAGI